MRKDGNSSKLVGGEGAGGVHSLFHVCMSSFCFDGLMYVFNYFISFKEVKS